MLWSGEQDPTLVATCPPQQGIATQGTEEHPVDWKRTCVVCVEVQDFYTLTMVLRPHKPSSAWRITHLVLLRLWYHFGVSSSVFLRHPNTLCLPLEAPIGFTVPASERLIVWGASGPCFF